MIDITAKEDKIMALVRLLRTGQITLPAEFRRRFKLNEGDLLEAAEVEGGILLRPVSVVDREKAWERVFAAMSRVEPTPEQAKKSLEEQEEEIYEIVGEFRRRHD